MGATGPQGSQGATGPQGSQGATGPQGPGTAGGGASADPEPDLALSATPQAVVSTTITTAGDGRVHVAGVVDVQKDGTTGVSAQVTCGAEIATFGQSDWTALGHPQQEDISTPFHHRQITAAASVVKPAGRYSLRLVCSGNNATAERANLTAWGTQNTP